MNNFQPLHADADQDKANINWDNPPVFRKPFRTSICKFFLPILIQVVALALTEHYYGIDRALAHIPSAYREYVSYAFYILPVLVVVHYMAFVRPYYVTFYRGGMKENYNILGNIDTTDFSRIEDIKVNVTIGDFILGLADITYLNREGGLRNVRDSITGLKKKDALILHKIMKMNASNNIVEMIQKSGGSSSGRRWGI